MMQCANFKVLISLTFLSITVHCGVAFADVEPLSRFEIRQEVNRTIFRKAWALQFWAERILLCLDREESDYKDRVTLLDGPYANENVQLMISRRKALALNQFMEAAVHFEDLSQNVPEEWKDVSWLDPGRLLRKEGIELCQSQKKEIAQEVERMKHDHGWIGIPIGFAVQPWEFVKSVGQFMWNVPGNIGRGIHMAEGLLNGDKVQWQKLDAAVDQGLDGIQGVVDSIEEWKKDPFDQLLEVRDQAKYAYIRMGTRQKGALVFDVALLFFSEKPIRMGALKVAPILSNIVNAQKLARKLDLALQEIQILKDIAYIDPLTRVFSMAALEEGGVVMNRIQNLLKLGPMQIGMIDADYFKVINDFFGHARGDEVIAFLAEQTRGIAKTVRAEDLVVRRGGEEFLIFFPNTTPLEAERAMERLAEAIENSKYRKILVGEIEDARKKKTAKELANVFRSSPDALPSSDRVGLISWGVTSYDEGKPLEDLLKLVDENAMQKKRLRFKASTPHCK